MADSWTINADEPEKDEKYEWRVPDADQQHVEETTPPADLKIKPKDISLKPTLAPEESGIQSGQSDWTFESNVDSSWYIFGTIVED